MTKLAKLLPSSSARVKLISKDVEVSGIWKSEWQAVLYKYPFLISRIHTKRTVSQFYLINER